MNKKFKFSSTILMVILSVSLSAQSVFRVLDQTNIPQGQSAKVTLKIAKKGINGLGKIQEYIPAGFSAAVTNKSMGKLKVDDSGNFKIQWMNLPLNDTVLVEYQLKNLSAGSGSYELKGKFTYLAGGAQKKVESETTSITVGKVKPEIVAVKKQPKKKEVPAPKPIVKPLVKKAEKAITVVENQPSVIESGIEVKPATITKKTETVQKADTPRTPLASSTNYIYSVQIGAYSQPKEISFFRYIPNVYMKQVDGLYKYYSGRFSTETEARERITTAKTYGIYDAFLVVQP